MWHGMWKVTGRWKGRRGDRNGTFFVDENWATTALCSCLLHPTAFPADTVSFSRRGMEERELEKNSVPFHGNCNSEGRGAICFEVGQHGKDSIVFTSMQSSSTSNHAKKAHYQEPGHQRSQRDSQSSYQTWVLTDNSLLKSNKVLWNSKLEWSYRRLSKR